MKRRDVLLAALALPFHRIATAQGRPVIADAHNHVGLLRRNVDAASKLGSLMRESGVSLLAWSVVPDAPFLRAASGGMQQAGSIRPGDLKASFDRQLGNARAGLNGNGARLVQTVADLDLAATGVPHVVLASEGADFLEGSLADLASAYERGIRHIQLVHYIRSPVGDLQTEQPAHHGLSAFGRDLVTALNTGGILVDAAHSSGSAVDQVLELSSVAPIWSHSYISRQEASWMTPGFPARALSEGLARKIAQKGGAVGLWSLGASFGGGLDAYASEIMRMADLLGPEHVMFGSDEDGLPQGAVIDSLDDLRRVVDNLARRGMEEKTLRAITFGNYARCLRNAMAMRIPAGGA